MIWCWRFVILVNAMPSQSHSKSLVSPFSLQGTDYPSFGKPELCVADRVLPVRLDGLNQQYVPVCWGG